MAIFMHTPNIVGWINPRRKATRQRAWKILNIVVAAVTIVNVSSLGVFAPRSVQAQAANVNGDLTSTITVNKYLKVGSSWILDNTSAYNLGFKWVLDDVVPAFNMGETASGLSFGEHTISENTPSSNFYPAGYFLSGSDNSCDDPAGTDGHLILDVQSTDGYVVNFCNQERTPTLGAVRVGKAVDTNGDGTFETTNPSVASGYAWKVLGTSDWRQFGSTAVVASDEYIIEEQMPADFHFVGWATVTDVDCGYLPELNTDTPTANVAVGQTAEISLCNAADPQHGTLTVHKQVDTDANGSFETTDPSQDAGYAWNLNSEDPWNAFGDSKQLTPGSYEVVEQMPSGYHMVGWTYNTPDGDICDSEHKINGPADPITGLEVNNNDTTTITICNARDTYEVQVRKVVDSLEDSPVLLNSENPWTWNTGDTVLHSQESKNLTAGDSHVISETSSLYPAADWSSAWSCSRVVNEGSFTVGSGTGRSFDPIEDWDTAPVKDAYYICRFDNTEREQPADGVIQGTKYYDWNRNNETDPGDQTLANWTIFLDLNDNDQPDAGETTTTDVNGDYSFTELAHGEYDVCEVLPNGWAHSTNPAGIPYPTYHTYCREADTGDTVDFHNYLTGAIHGMKWSDLNGNGQYDQNFFPPELCDILPFLCGPNEPKLPNWTIFLDQNENSTLDLGEQSTTTDSSGNYAFDDLQPGTYTVCEVQQADWNQTFPATGNSCHEVEIPYNLIGSNSGCHPDFPIGDLVQGDYLPFSGAAICNFGNEPLPNLTIVKTVDKATANPGDTLTYTITLTNNGPADATGVRVDDILPSSTGTPFELSRETSGASEAGHLTWDNITVLANNNMVITFKVVINGSLPVGTTTISNTANLSNSPAPTLSLSALHTSSLSLTVPSVTVASTPIYAGSSTATTLVTVVAPSLTITKTNNSGAFVNPGATVTYTVVVSNSAGATQAATNVNLADTLPAGFTFTVDGGSTKTFALGSIAPGASVTTTYATAISGSQLAGTYTNTAVAQGNNTVGVGATSNVVVQVPQVLGVSTAPALTLTKSVSPTTTNPGKIVTYTMVVTNTGTANATGVVLTDTLPAGFTFVTGGKSTLLSTIGTLAVGASTTTTVKVKVGDNVKAGTYTNRASVKADGVAAVNAQANIKVVIPQVLGLAITGAGWRDYAIFTLGLSLIAAGFIMARRSRRAGEVKA